MDQVPDESDRAGTGVHGRLRLPYVIWFSFALRVHSHPQFFSRELLREIVRLCNCEKWVHNPLLSFTVHAKVDQIASINGPTYYSTTHYLANSSRLINLRHG